MHENLTVQELGTLLKVAPRTLNEWRRAGIIPCARLGWRTVRYNANDVVAALKGRQERSNCGPAGRAALKGGRA